MEELVSVIIPNYNKEQYLPTCLDSVLNQTYMNIEIVIVDDCSTDLSRKIISQYADRYKLIHPVFLERNGGVSRARNMGIKLAKGKYVTALDSDDFYTNNRKLEKELETLTIHNSHGIAYSYRLLLDQKGQAFQEERTDLKRYISGDAFFRLLTEPNAYGFVQRDYCISKEYLISAGGYDESSSYYEDYDLLLRLTRDYPLYYTGADGTGYRIISTGLSTDQRKNDGRQFRIPQKIRLKYISYLPLNRRLYALCIWLIESAKLEIRISGRKILRIVRHMKGSLYGKSDGGVKYDY